MLYENTVAAGTLGLLKAQVGFGNLTGPGVNARGIFPYFCIQLNNIE
jgi:hypothetical protein